MKRLSFLIVALLVVTAGNAFAWDEQEEQYHPGVCSGSDSGSFTYNGLSSYIYCQASSAAVVSGSGYAVSSISGDIGQLTAIAVGNEWDDVPGNLYVYSGNDLEWEFAWLCTFGEGYCENAVYVDWP